MSLFGRLFGSRKETESSVSLASLRTDMHSHVIPGIDDGAATMQDSLAMLEAFTMLGFKKIITTPHIMSDGYRNTPEIILGGLEKVRAAAKNAGMDIEIEAAAEYYLDEVFLQKLDKGLLCFGGAKKYVLFETSYVTQPMSLSETIFKLQTNGYTPVLAHPERYQYFWSSKNAVEEIREIRDRGAKLQVNISSFAGRQSKVSGTISRKLAKEGLIDFLGTDMHRSSQSDTLANTLFEIRELRDLVESGTLLNSTL